MTTSRRKFIAGNWKMNTTLSEAIGLATEISRSVSRDAEIALFPPFPWLMPVAQAVTDTEVKVGAQNVAKAESGAFTGEVSARMLADVCQYVIVGHSERRQLFNETDADVNCKAQLAAEAELSVILCIGEPLAVRQVGDHESYVLSQLEASLHGLPPSILAQITIAYEPVWAIGTGVAATSEDAQEMASSIRVWLSSRSRDLDQQCRILYGGSVTPANATEILRQQDVDGALVGSASLQSESFLAICAAAEC